MKKLLVSTGFVLGLALSAYGAESCFGVDNYTLRDTSGKTISLTATTACVAGKFVFLNGVKDPKVIAVTNKGCYCSNDNRIITTKG